MGIVDQLALGERRKRLRSYLSGNSRSANIMRTCVVGIAGNLLLAAVKFVVSFTAHSVAIASDALNNLSDALSSVLTIVGTILSDKAPDHDHPYGYGRTEYLFTVAIGVLIVLGGADTLREAVEHLRRPVDPDYSVLSLVMLCVALLVKMGLGWFYRKRGAELASDSLSGAGQEAIMDVAMSGSTILSALFATFLGFSVDIPLAIVISLLVLKSGVEILLSSFSKIVGQRVEGPIIQELKDSLEKVSGVEGVYDIRLFDYGPDNLRGTVTLEVDEGTSTATADHIASAAKLAAFVDHHVLIDAVGIRAVTCDDEVKAMRERIEKLARAHVGVVDVCGFRLVRDKRLVTFDVVIDYNGVSSDVLVEAISDEAAEEFPGYRFLVTTVPLMAG